jgi:hypothetical protein
MKKLFLFNPENDMALGCGDIYYKPTAVVQRMARELSALPAWYAPAGSAVWTDADFGSWPVRPEGVECVRAFTPDYELCPWGWNPALVHRLGIQKEVEGIRRLSSRRTAVEVLAELGGGSSEWITSVEALYTYIYNKECVLKAPWSGSGRGVYFVSRTGLTDSQRGWAERILRTQGALVGEPRYRGVVDFAMEFRADEQGEVHFVGYSLFETDGQGAYKGNVLASDEEIEAQLTRYVGREQLWEVRRRLQDILCRKLEGQYEGCLGVDMMIRSEISEEARYFLHPCVEINLRMNMGLVAHRFYEHYVSPGAKGQFVVAYSPRKGEALERHGRMQAENPCMVSENRVVKGYLSLTPVAEDTCYQVYIVIE